MSQCLGSFIFTYNDDVKNVQKIEFFIIFRLATTWVILIEQAIVNFFIKNIDSYLYNWKYNFDFRQMLLSMIFLGRRDLRFRLLWFSERESIPTQRSDNFYWILCLYWYRKNQFNSIMYHLKLKIWLSLPKSRTALPVVPVTKNRNEANWGNMKIGMEYFVTKKGWDI